MNVVRVRTRETLLRPDVASLVMRSAVAVGLPSSGAVMAQLARDVAAPHLGIFVGFDGEEPKGIGVVELPTSAFQHAAMIVLAYCEGDRALTMAVCRRVREWLTAAGFQEAQALNFRHTDRSFLRGFAHFGTPGRVGSVIRFML